MTKATNKKATIATMNGSETFNADTFKTSINNVLGSESNIESSVLQWVSYHSEFANVSPTKLPTEMYQGFKDVLSLNYFGDKHTADVGRFIVDGDNLHRVNDKAFMESKKTKLEITAGYIMNANYEDVIENYGKAVKKHVSECRTACNKFINGKVKTWQKIAKKLIEGDTSGESAERVERNILENIKWNLLDNPTASMHVKCINAEKRGKDSTADANAFAIIFGLAIDSYADYLKAPKKAEFIKNLELKKAVRK
jgi:hypothetical protein